ncbi:GGDEF domain-containing protein [Aestuariibacter salexigens]|uniref:GGDEF domain-containing protein n=1 Tax=Aestuariibacter salexigens TaxID=226010 RepID=UPI000688651E|nr:GGDEF domain-containing protein [Aestuariibacter salexigens]
MLFFVMGAAGFALTWASLDEGRGQLLFFAVLFYCINIATLLVALQHYERKTYQHNYLLYGFMTALLACLTLVKSIEGLVLIEVLVGLTLLPIALRTVIGGYAQYKNYGIALLGIAILLQFSNTLFQIFWLLTLDNRLIVFASSVFTQAVSFVFLGLGLTASLLIDEQRKLAELTVMDPLTELYNRRGMTQIMNADIDANKSVNVIAIDIDHFKKVNDTYGHEGGDVVLTEFARLVRSLARSTDVCCRLGGEEFLLFASDSSVSHCEKLAERIRSCTEQSSIQYDNYNISITASFGVAGLQTGESLESLIKRADEALYIAKQQGRNKVIVAPVS